MVRHTNVLYGVKTPPISLALSIEGIIFDVEMSEKAYREMFIKAVDRSDHCYQLLYRAKLVANSPLLSREGRTLYGKMSKKFFEKFLLQ